jgi:TPR repeat protein
MLTASFKFRPLPPMSLPSIVLLMALCCLVGPQLAEAGSYEEGRMAYISGDYKKAFSILQPLATEGDSEAQKMLGIMYDYGHGVKANSEKALLWYLRSAEQGHPAVQYQVGAKYFRGDGVKQNYQEAARWWEMAANGGQVDAQFNLGLMYFRGLSIAADDEKAAALFVQAAEQGHGHSQYSLAVMYAFGRGLKKDYYLALDWFRKSADQGIGQAQFNLGVFYENGYGVEKDIEVAKSWYEKAAAQGTAEAELKLTELNSPDTSAESVEAELVAGNNAVENEYRISDIAIDGIKRESWVLSQAPEQYTLQIGSVIREDDIVNFLKDNRVTNEAAYIQVVIKEVTRYNALYGVYDSYAEANTAIEDLPKGLRKVKPWVRSFRMIQQLLNQDDSN